MEAYWLCHIGDNGSDTDEYYFDDDEYNIPYDIDCNLHEGVVRNDTWDNPYGNEVANTLFLKATLEGCSYTMDIDLKYCRYMATLIYDDSSFNDEDVEGFVKANIDKPMLVALSGDIRMNRIRWVVLSRYLMREFWDGSKCGWHRAEAFVCSNMKVLHECKYFV